MSPTRPAPGTLKWWVIGSLGIAAGIALATWLGLAATLGDPTWQTTAYKVVGDEQVRVSFQVYNPSGKDLTCTVEALARDFGRVGTLDVPVAASDSPESQHTVVVRTTSKAVTGDVKTCS
ncbi:MAG: DUF4307 domain-containing protein [Terracoccus sp.]